MGKSALKVQLGSGEVIQPAASPNGKRVPNQLVNTPTFAGTLALNNPLGTIWDDLAQSGALAIGVGEDVEEGGCDCVRIVADGNTITLDAAYTWVKMSSDSIGTTAADVNELIFVCKKLTYTNGVISGGTILYSVKLNP